MQVSFVLLDESCFKKGWARRFTGYKDCNHCFPFLIGVTSVAKNRVVEPEVRTMGVSNLEDQRPLRCQSPFKRANCVFQDTA